MLGNEHATIEEGGRTVLREGKGIANTRGVAFVQMSDGYALFTVGSGSYSFAVE